MSTLKTNNLQLLDSSRNIAVSKIAEMNGGFSFRNKIIDGRFDFWYEGTSQTSSGYGSDTMWHNANVGSTKVNSQQPLTAGVDLPAIEVPTAKYFSRTVVTSVAGANNLVAKVTKIEDVGTLAGKTATLSFYAKADAVKNITAYFSQQFGTGGSTTVDGIGGQLISLSTVWKRYSVQVTFPSITGKIIGTGNAIALIFGFDLGSGLPQMPNSCGQQSGTFDIACVQLEEGSVATPFEELPMEISQTRVNRYYETGSGSLIGSAACAGYFVGSFTFFKQIKRAVPTITWGVTFEYVNIATFNYTVGLDCIRQYPNVADAGNAYISRDYIADARL